ncbi:hypothetical protein Ahy_B04g071526 isoform A [Arachis hypogaea]|uniref:Transposase MuDR plant domain-containing protein n=1 Tax=Arachis hypogaea TaxID=3818 RepID=A0A444ZKX9_ARAHY|nr:hypothetical protein Ahy_B04g071526 isoform A [Arachis hypogaea]
MHAVDVLYLSINPRSRADFRAHTGIDAVGDDVIIDELRELDWGEYNNDSEEEFEADYEVDDKNDDGDLAKNLKAQNEAHAIVSQHPFDVSLFIRTLDLEAMHALEFPEYVNIGEGNAAAEDDKFSVRMKFGSRESVISAIKRYTISRGVDYTTFYAKCKGYGAGCDWLIRASLIRKKGCWEIRRYNDKHTCTMGMISQDHAKLDSDTIADAIRLPSIKVKSVIAELQSMFNYTVSYRKAWLAKQKAVANVFGDWEVSYQTLPVSLKVMTAKMSRSRVQIKMLLVYRESEEVQGAIAQDGNQNIVPVAFAIVEGEMTDAWEFFLTNLWRYVVTTDGVGIISDQHTSIDAAVARSNGISFRCYGPIHSNFVVSAYD